jgi:hypothetical protein
MAVTQIRVFPELLRGRGLDGARLGAKSGRRGRHTGRLRRVPPRGTSLARAQAQIITNAKLMDRALPALDDWLERRQRGQ